MATSLTANTLFSVYGTYGTDADIEDAVANIFPKYLQAYSNGTGSQQANTWYADTLSLTTSPTSMDLFTGMTDRYGNAIVFTTIRGIAIVNKSATAFVQLSGSFIKILASGTTITWLVYPGGIFFSQHPLGAAGSSTYELGITVSRTIVLQTAAGTADVDLLLIGTR